MPSKLSKDFSLSQLNDHCTDFSLKRIFAENEIYTPLQDLLLWINKNYPPKTLKNLKRQF